MSVQCIWNDLALFLNDFWQNPALRVSPAVTWLTVYRRLQVTRRASFTSHHDARRVIRNTRAWRPRVARNFLYILASFLRKS